MARRSSAWPHSSSSEARLWLQSSGRAKELDPAPVNAAVMFLAAGPVSVCGSVLEGAHGLLTGSRAVCEMGTPETLSGALCSALVGKSLRLQESTAGLEPAGNAVEW